MGFTPQEESSLIRIAHRAIEALFDGKSPEEECASESSRFGEVFEEKRALFVSLFLNSELRGSAGYLMPLVPLWRATMENARNAAFRDPRFTPLWRDELFGLEIVIHVISRRTPMDAEGVFNPATEGLLFRKGSRTAVFLPRPWMEHTPEIDEIVFRLNQEVTTDSDDSSGAVEREYLLLDAIIREGIRPEEKSSASGTEMS